MWLAFGKQTWELRDGEVLVGSGADAVWRVATADLMPRHFSITVHGLNASLRPASKDNVVVVNGKQLTAASHLLNDGDVILAGSGAFVFSDGPPTFAPVDLPSDAGFLIEDAAQVVHPLASRSTTLGRDSSNAIVVRDPTASRFHAEVRREAGGFALHSMGSGGTLLNGKKLGGPRLLRDGDAIEVAYTRFRFATSAPAGIALAGAHEMTGELARRNPTLTTGRISVVPESRGPGWMAIAVVAVLVVAVAAAIAIYR